MKDGETDDILETHRIEGLFGHLAVIHLHGTEAVVLTEHRENKGGCHERSSDIDRDHGALEFTAVAASDLVRPDHDEPFPLNLVVYFNLGGGFRPFDASG